MDVQHRHLLEFGLILLRVNTVNGTHVHAGSVFGADAGVGDDERHQESSK
jgi:hypothetical protein